VSIISLPLDLELHFLLLISEGKVAEILEVWPRKKISSPGQLKKL